MLAAAVHVSVAVESAWSASEAAIRRAAIGNGLPVRSCRHDGNASGTAAAARDKAHRDRADSRGTHHGQDDAARTFHVVVPQIWYFKFGT